MAYAAISKPSLKMNTVLYTGTGASLAITGVGFEPDMVWTKCRSAIGNGNVFDSVRGATKRIFPHSTSAESTDAETLKTFDSDGFTVGTSDNVNVSSETYASWNWLAATTHSGATGGSGTAKTYTASVDTTSGISITKYTGNGTSGHTVPHNLGAIPKIIFTKELGGAGSWFTHVAAIDDYSKVLFLNTDSAESSQAYSYNAAPTSSVITYGNDGDLNGNDQTYIAYSFAEIKGYSKFLSYVGNGSTDGAFVYTGFKPAFVMVKRIDGVVNWQQLDNKRSNTGGTNIIDEVFAPNTTDAEYDEGSSAWCGDLLSNGFKWRGDWSALNTSGGNYMFMAFASEPLVANVGDNGIPATAR